MDVTSRLRIDCKENFEITSESSGSSSENELPSIEPLDPTTTIVRESGGNSKTTIKVDENHEKTKAKQDKYKGWLKKTGGRFKTIKRRFFVLKGNCLYYKVDEKTKPIGVIPLINIEVNITGNTTFTLKPTTDCKPCKIDKNNNFTESNHEIFVLKAETIEEMTKWVDEINKRNKITNKKNQIQQQQ